MKDKISIITTVYNSEKYILKCLSSVNRQKVNKDKFSIEYIIVDDCSTDHSYEIIQTYFKESKFKNVKPRIYKTETNLGCGAARKYGISLAKGKYIMFLDSDDYYIKDDFVWSAYNAITMNDADIVEYGFKYISTDGERKNVVSDKSYIIQNNPLGNLLSLLNDNIIQFMPWTKIIKKSIIDTKEYSDYREFEDIRTTPYWIYNAKKICIMNEIAINYRLSKNSIMRNNSNHTRLETVKALTELAESFKDNIEILKAIYQRALIDIKTILNLDSDSLYYREMSKLNTKLLSIIYPDRYEKFTYDVEL